MQLTHGNLSHHAIAQTVVLFDLTGQIESMADYGEKIALLLEKYSTAQTGFFTQADCANLELMAKKTKDILKHTRQALGHFPNHAPQDKQIAAQLLRQAQIRENNLNQLRQKLRNEHNMRAGENGENAAVSITAYGDILNHFERIGDCALNVTQEALRCKPTSRQHTTANPQ